MKEGDIVKVAVFNKGVQSQVLTLTLEAWNPYEPAAYVTDPYWDCFDGEDNYSLYMSGIIEKAIPVPDAPIDELVYIGTFTFINPPICLGCLRLRSDCDCDEDWETEEY